MAGWVRIYAKFSPTEWAWITEYCQGLQQQPKDLLLMIIKTWRYENDSCPGRDWETAAELVVSADNPTEGEHQTYVELPIKTANWLRAYALDIGASLENLVSAMTMHWLWDHYQTPGNKRGRQTVTAAMHRAELKSRSSND